MHPILSSLASRRGGAGTQLGFAARARRIVLSRLAPAAAVVAFASGCSSTLPPPAIVKQANPNALLGVKHYVVAPLTWNGFTYDGQPEATWLASRTPKQQESWAEDKPRVAANMIKAFGGGEKHDDEVFSPGDAPGPGQLLLAINVDSYDGQLEWTLKVEDANKNVLDEVHSIRNNYLTLNTWAAENFFCSMAPATIMQYLRTRYAPAAP